MRPTLFLTIGDPAGVGPEVTVRALASGAVGGAARLVAVGDRRVLERAAGWTGASVQFSPYDPEREVPPAAGAVELVDLANMDLAACSPGKLDSGCGKAAYAYIEEAVRRCLRGEGEGLVTAPINKRALNAAGLHFAGHTEILASLCGAGKVAMLLVAPRLRIAHVSTHCSLAQAIDRAKPDRIRQVALLTVEALQDMGIDRPRLAVAGLNPHAGEGGLFGDEEARYITPAVEELRGLGLRVSGPEPPDTVFLRTLQGQFDAVLAMYHDQGHIPIKLLGFNEGVNVTLGLPIVRTSVDHGTAFDIAGTGRADAGSMVAAIALAARLVAARAARRAATI